MKIEDIIDKRRAYRSLDAVDITDDIIEKLVKAAQLAPSCFNNQPWHFVFVRSKERIKEMHDALSKGNEWAKDASMYIAVCARKTDDCVIYDREYFLFDTGLATGFLILQATNIGLVAHPIAGYSPKRVRQILSIPEDMEIITLIILGKHANIIKTILSEKQKKEEITRPLRKPFTAFAHYEMFNKENMK